MDCHCCRLFSTRIIFRFVSITQHVFMLAQIYRPIIIIIIIIKQENNEWRIVKD